MTTQPRIVCPLCQGKRSIYLGCGENVPCTECNSTGEKHLAPTLTMGRVAAARTRADIAGRVMASLLQVACARFDRVNADKVAAHAVEATDALLAELERTAK